MILRNFTPAMLCLVMGVSTTTGDRSAEPSVGTPGPQAGVAIAPPPREALPLRVHFAGVPMGGGEQSDSLSGTVFAVDKTSITVDAEPKRIEQWNAKGEFVRTIIIPPQPPRTFQAVGSLAQGGYPRDGLPRYQYRLSDVKVGDKVSFDWRRINGVYQTHYICIFRRPGGRVPPSPAEKQDEKDPWHDRCNAFQDLEEKGIPLPEKYRPKPSEIPPRIP